MEKNPNINKRVSPETKNKIEEIIERDNIQAKDLFALMINLYEKQNGKDVNLPNYEKDIDDLSLALDCISNIYSNIVSKTKLHINKTVESYELSKDSIRAELENEFKGQLESVLNERNQALREYDSIAKEAELILKDSKALREECENLKKELSNLKESNNIYQEKISSLQDKNSLLEERVSNQTSLTDIENLKKEHSMEIMSLKLEKEKEINKIQEEKQKEINSLRDKLAEENNKYNELHSAYLELKYKK